MDNPGRRSVQLAALVGVATLVIVTIVGSGVVTPVVPPVEDERTTAAAPSTPCIRTGPLTSVAAINRFVASSPGGEGFRWGDVGIDVGLRGRRRLWLFADTLRASDAEGAHLVRNSGLMFSPGCVEVLASVPNGGPLIPDRADGVGYWPMSAFRAPGAGRDGVYVMTQRVKTVSAGLFGFKVLGPSVAVLDVPWDGSPTVVGVHDLGSDYGGQRRPVWGAALAVSNGWIYLYGTTSRRLSGIHGFALYVVRTRPTYLLDVDRWTYWNGQQWTREAGDAAPLIDERGGVSETLSVFEEDGRWFALSKRNEFLGEDLVIWTAASPIGPFDEGTVVAALPCPSTTKLTYLPVAHPELLSRRGTVVVSWSRNSTSFEDLCADPAGYRPQFRRVRLPR